MQIEMPAVGPCLLIKRTHQLLQQRRARGLITGRKLRSAPAEQAVDIAGQVALIGPQRRRIAIDNKQAAA